MNTTPPKAPPDSQPQIYFKSNILQPVPRFETETELEIARRELERCIDHPSSIFLGTQPSLNIREEPVYILKEHKAEPRIVLGQWLAAATYLSHDARVALQWCLRQGPLFFNYSPALAWERAFDWSQEKGLTVLAEIQVAGHAFDVQAPDSWPNTKMVTLWKFSERPCGLPADELRNNPFITGFRQFAVHGLRKLSNNFPYNRTNGLRLGHEVPRLNGILPPWAVDWFVRKTQIELREWNQYLMNDYTKPIEHL